MGARERETDIELATNATLHYAIYMTQEMRHKHTEAIDALELAQKLLNIEEYFDEAESLETAITVLGACA